MGFHILRVTHATLRLFLLAAPSPPSRRRLRDILFRFSSNGASARYRSNPRRWIRSRSRVYGLLTLFFSRFRSPALSLPRLSQLHPYPGCIGIPTQRSDRSAPVVLPPSGFSDDFRRAAVTVFRRDAFISRGGIRHTDVGVAASRAASIFSGVKKRGKKKEKSSPWLEGINEKNLARRESTVFSTLRGLGWPGKRELSMRSSKIIRESGSVVRGKTCFFPAPRWALSPWESAFFATMHVIARARTDAPRIQSGMRIVSSRHEPLVKNIRSGFKGKRERTIEKRERERGEDGEKDHTPQRSSIVFVHLRENHRVRWFDSLLCLGGTRTSKPSSERESRGFPSEKYLLWFSSVVLVTGSTRRARYINYAGTRCTKVAKRRNRGCRSAAWTEPDLSLRRGIKSLSCLFLN